MTGLIAGFGDSAVAAWAVVGRLTVVAFGGIFSLSGAIAGIFSQNYGAGLYHRVRATYRDALIFCALYSCVMWGILMLASQKISLWFSLDPAGNDVLYAFTHFGAGGFILIGVLMVSNAAFNALALSAKRSSLSGTAAVPDVMSGDRGTAMSAKWRNNDA